VNFKDDKTYSNPNEDKVEEKPPTGDEKPSKNFNNAINN